MDQALAKHGLYLNAFFKTAKAAKPEEADPEVIKKLIFYGVKTISIWQKPLVITRGEVMATFQFADLIQGLIGLLKPKEFVNLFPIAKEYDGNKYQTKDYFYTRDYIKSLPDEPIGNIDSVTKFLWEYHNWEISMFVVNVMGYVSDLRRLEGQPGIMEEWCSENGIKTYSMRTDQRGKRFMVDNETGKSFRIKRKMPRYLRLVK